MEKGYNSNSVRCAWPIIHLLFFGHYALFYFLSLKRHAPPGHAHAGGAWPRGQPASVTAARRLHPATVTARQSHDPQPRPLAGQHLQKVHVGFDQGAAEATELGRIKLICYGIQGAMLLCNASK